MIFIEDVFDYARKKKWFDVGITCIHRTDSEEELITTYFRGRTVQEALKFFDEKCGDDYQIITCWLFNEENIENEIKSREEDVENA